VNPISSAFCVKAISRSLEYKFRDLKMLKCLAVKHFWVGPIWVFLDRIMGFHQKFVFVYIGKLKASIRIRTTQLDAIEIEPYPKKLAMNKKGPFAFLSILYV